MMLTTKGRYAVMALVDIAMHSSDAKPTSLASIAERQGITVPYLEQLFSRLKAAGLVKSVRGPGGGYRLFTEAQDISVAAVIDAVDEPIKMTRCEQKNGHGCLSTRARCLTHDLWDGLSQHIYHYLASVSLEDVCKRRVKVNGLFSDGSGAGSSQFEELTV